MHVPFILSQIPIPFRDPIRGGCVVANLCVCGTLSCDWTGKLWRPQSISIATENNGLLHARIVLSLPPYWMYAN
jgi:hypothetical protein